MDIGTAKPDAAELAFTHRLIDILDPSVAYSAADFRRDALAAMHRDNRAGKNSAAGRRNHDVFQKRCWKDYPPLAVR